MSAKKIETILNMIEVAEGNLRTAKNLLMQLNPEKQTRATIETSRIAIPKSSDEDRAVEVVEGYFDGENMIGDNGQTYLVPPNYASKTQLVVGDRMKWILTPEREVFKLIGPVPRERVVGVFAIEGDNFVVLVDKFTNPVKILKASATFAMKNLGLNVGDEVAILIPRDAQPTWGAFSSVVKSQNEINNKPVESAEHSHTETSEIDLLSEFKLDDINVGDNHDYF
jgi:hypothetical protein